MRFVMLTSFDRLMFSLRSQDDRQRRFRQRQDVSAKRVTVFSPEAKARAASDLWPKGWLLRQSCDGEHYLLFSCRAQLRGRWDGLLFILLFFFVLLLLPVRLAWESEIDKIGTAWRTVWKVRPSVNA